MKVKEWNIHGLFWLYIKDSTTDTTGTRHIFNKGNNTKNNDTDGDYMDTNGPGLYLHVRDIEADKYKIVDLEVLIDNFEVRADGTTNTISVPDLPLNKWVSVIIRAEHKTIDVFINGILVRREIFSDIIKQNYGDIYVSQAVGTDERVGFDGKISNLWYL